jgi:hypothetical protein
VALVRKSHPLIRIKSVQLLGCLAALSLPVSLFAQTPAEVGAADARLHLGPLALDPRLAVRNVGVDTNALNDAATPTQDFTASIGPELDSWLRIGRVHLTGQSQIDWNYFQKLTTQRSFDVTQDGRADLDLGYLIPHVSASYLRTRQRPNFEIDARVARRITGVGGGVQLKVGAKLSVDVEQERREVDFGKETFGGVGLADSLNRSERETSLTARYVLTPLTTLVIRASHQRDRFVFSPVRDTDSLAVVPGLEFKPLALIAGSVSVGFRRFEPTSDALPAFRGVVADVDVRYQAGELMRFDLEVTRDLDYSFEPLEPYFLASGTTLQVTQALGASWDVVGRVGRTTLDYRAVMQETGGTAGLSASRLDRIIVVGGGLGRRLASNIRLGFDVDRAARRSNAAGRNYEGMRIGGSVTYGF